MGQRASAPVQMPKCHAASIPKVRPGQMFCIRNMNAAPDTFPDYYHDTYVARGYNRLAQTFGHEYVHIITDTCMFSFGMTVGDFYQPHTRSRFKQVYMTAHDVIESICDAKYRQCVANGGADCQYVCTNMTQNALGVQVTEYQPLNEPQAAVINAFLDLSQVISVPNRGEVTFQRFLEFPWEYDLTCSVTEPLFFTTSDDRFNCQKVARWFVNEPSRLLRVLRGLGANRLKRKYEENARKRIRMG
jgi:hypothetical protein